jgi:hypothetical protein
MVIRRPHYNLLIFILGFYFTAQVFQQYVRLGPLSGVEGLEQNIMADQHPLNYTRMVLILLSMFLMVPGAIILGLHFYQKSPLLSIVSIVFFLFFCLFETSYRSVQLFQVTMVWGSEFSRATPEIRAALLPKFQNFYDSVNALYFPLLFSLLLGSTCLLFASLKDNTSKLVSVAMGVHVIQQLSRLSSYTPFDALNIFTGFWYFLFVAIVFGLLIYWAVRMSQESAKKNNSAML